MEDRAVPLPIESEIWTGGANNRIVSVLFFAAAALLTLLTLMLIVTGWRTGVSLTPTSGTWIALADDLKHGVFYRPMVSGLGYGGTRYLPLHFVLQAGLMKMGLGPGASGHTLEAAAGLGLLFGIYRILRHLRIGSRTAACVSLVVLAPKATQIAELSIRGDLLPCALVVLGLATCMPAKVDQSHVWGSALLFTLAFSAKPTSLYGAAAVFLSFLFSRQYGRAVNLLLATGLGCAAVVGAISLASGGRFLTVLRACAVTAGFSIPSGMWRLGVTPALLLPVDLIFIVLGFAAFLALARGKISSIPAMLFAMAAVSTMIVMGAAGTNINHFLDLDVASLIVFSAWLFDEETKERTFGVAVLAMAAIFASFPIFWSTRHPDNGGYFDFAYSRGLHDTVEFLGKQDKLILAAHPLVPIMAGQRPYLLDIWMFREVSEKNASFGDALSDAIRQRKFGAIVLEDDLGSRDAPYSFGDREIKDIRQNYQLARQFPRAYVFLPKGPQDSTAPAASKGAGEP